MSDKGDPKRNEASPRAIKRLPQHEIIAILRGAGSVSAAGGRSLLAKLLKGSREKAVYEHGLDANPVFGYYQELSEDEILSRIDWLIDRGYLALDHEGRRPLLVLTPRGREIERQAVAVELMDDFDELLEQGPPYDLTFLVEGDRELIPLLLDKVAQSRDPKYIPLLEAWSVLEFKKVRNRIQQVIAALQRP